MTRPSTAAMTRFGAVAAVALAMALVAGGCTDDPEAPGAPTAPTTTLMAPRHVVEAVIDGLESPAALAATPEGGLLIGERLTGTIRRVGPDLAGPGQVVVRVDVADAEATGGSENQRGLLGLAVDGDRIFALWTRSVDGRIVVAQVAPGAQRLVWEGPVSDDRANGGRLLWRDGTLVTAVGDLARGQPSAAESAAGDVRGAIIELDPDADAGQEPVVLSRGWNNPFAITVSGDGDLWLGDNIGGGCCERLAHLPTSAPGSPAITQLGDDQHQIVPSAIVELAGGRFGVCSYFTGQMYEVEVVDGAPSVPGDALFDGCSVAGVTLSDGRIAMATETTISVGTA